MGTSIRVIVVVMAVFFCAASASNDEGTAQPGEACGSDGDCVPGSVCFNQFCVGDGVLRFSLSWTADSDFDLHVMSPTGNEIYWQNTTADGGQLDVDQCAAGCTAGQHVENIVFTEGAPLGQYAFWVENF